ncbi:MAG TPA: fibronectin type III domain-containing protein, partial [Prolixibacteraceae bacterium]
MTISWTNPGVTSAVGYAVYNSTDNVNFNYVTQVASGVNSVVVNGLNPGTLYYFKVFGVTEGGLSSALTGSQSTNSAPVTGTKTIGTTGSNYTSITAAIADAQTNGLSGSVIFELQNDYTTAGETFPITFSGIVTSAVNNLTIRPAAGVSSLAISPAATFLQTFVFNGASYITIDGRPGGSGLTKALTIANSAVSSTGTIFFQNDATHNLIEYCNLTGVPGVAGGAVIGFSTTTGTLGNSNNTIDNCNITDGGVGGIFNAIYSSGTVGKENKLNLISNNNISNFFTGSANFSAITLTTGNTDWTIQGNSFFETIARADNQAKNVIYINNTGTNYIVRGNYIGGSAPLAGGTPWSDAGFNAAMGLNCIYISAPGSNDTVSNNTITNFSLSSASNASGSMYAINVSGGNVTVTNNTIGSSTAPIFISFTGSYGITGFMGISASATISGNVSNNTILGLTYTGFSQVLGAISISGTALIFTVNANLIGSTGAANNITSPTFIGLQNACSGTVNISNNILANINSSTIGIYNTGGTANITGNSIFNNSGTALTGISHVTGTLAVNISN